MQKVDLRKVLNYLRASIGHGDGRAAINVVRKYSPAYYKQLVACAYRVPNQGGVPLLAGKIHDTRQLLSYKPFDTVSLNCEIEWAVCQLERNFQILSCFVRQRDSLQVSLLQNGDESLLSAIDEFEKSCGYSGWLINAKIALLQLRVGQEAQKDYAADVIEKCTGLPVAIAHLASQRNEDAVTTAGFYLRAKNTVDAWNMIPAWETYLTFIALGKVPDGDDDLSSLLRVGGSGSIIDLFEAFIAVVAKLVSRKNLEENLIKQLKAALIRLRNIGDYRLVGLRLILGLEDEVQDSESAAIFRQILTSSRASDTYVSSSEFSNKLCGLYQCVINHNSAGETAAFELEKTSLNFGFLPLGHVIGVVASQISSSGVFFSHEALLSEMNVLLGKAETIWLPGSAFADREPTLRELEKSTMLKDYVRAESLCALLADGDDFEIVVAAKARFSIAESSGDWWAAIKLAVDCRVRYPGAAHEFVVSSLFQSRSWADIKPYSGDIVLAIALSMALRELDSGPEAQKINRHLQQVALRVLKSRGFNFFSELGSLAEGDEYMKLFLREVCVASVMEVNTKVRSSRALSEERMKICQALAVSDEVNSSGYFEEIKQLTFGLELEEGIRHFDSSRLFVNLDGLSKWGMSALAEDFSRYISLRNKALPDVAGIQAALITIQMETEKGAPIPAALLEQPRTEADRLLLDIVQRLCREFLHSPVHGLNSFLSLRIRHGSLAGHLRGPLEELGVIGSKRDEEGEYFPIERWSPLIESFPLEVRSRFNQAFSTFSLDFDQRIFWVVDELLQVKSDRKIDGAFDIPVTVFLINALKGHIRDASSLPGVIDACLTHFKSSLEPVLSDIRSELTVALKADLDNLLQRLFTELRIIAKDQNVVSAMDAIGRARTNLASAIDRVSSWFVPLDRAASDRAYSVEQIVRMGEKLTTNARPTFQPNIDLVIDGELPWLRAQPGAFMVADALFIALDNVYLHSGLSNPVDISVRVGISKEGFMSFRIENDVATSASVEESKKKLEKIRSQLDSGEFRVKVAGEGGTGLFKLRRLGDANAFEGRSNIDFGFVGSRFYVDLLVPVMVSGINQEAMNEALNS